MNEKVVFLRSEAVWRPRDACFYVAKTSGGLASQKTRKNSSGPPPRATRSQNDKNFEKLEPKRTFWSMVLGYLQKAFFATQRMRRREPGPKPGQGHGQARAKLPLWFKLGVSGLGFTNHKSLFQDQVSFRTGVGVAWQCGKRFFDLYKHD